MTEFDTSKMAYDEMIDSLRGILFSPYIRTTAREREALDMAIKVLEQEPCEDAISRQAVVDYNNFLNELRKLPSVQPKVKTGHWIQISSHSIYECSECGQTVMTSDICAYEFCHGCGLRMVELQKSEDKE